MNEFIIILIIFLNILMFLIGLILGNLYSVKFSNLKIFFLIFVISKFVILKFAIFKI